MKPLACSACLLAVCMAAAAEQSREDEIRVLSATVKMHAAQIETLKAENAELRQQIAQLRALCQEAGIQLESPTTAKAGSTNVIYLDKKRTVFWFDSAYRRHKDKIAVIDGQYVDIGETALKRTTVSEEPPTPGDLYRITPAGSQVLQILGPEEVVIQRQGLQSVERDIDSGKVEATVIQPLLYHVTGVDTATLAVGKLFGGKLIYVGSFPHTTPKGRSASMQSFRPYTPLTREQFSDALAKGFRLYRYSRSGKEIIKTAVN